MAKRDTIRVIPLIVIFFALVLGLFYYQNTIKTRSDASEANIIYMPSPKSLGQQPPCADGAGQVLIFNRRQLGDLRYLGYNAGGSQVVSSYVKAPGNYTVSDVSSMYHREVHRLNIYVSGSEHSQAAPCLHDYGIPRGSNSYIAHNQTANPVAIRTWWIIDQESGFSWSCTAASSTCTSPVIWVPANGEVNINMPVANASGDRPMLAIEDQQYELDLQNGLQVPPPWQW